VFTYLFDVVICLCVSKITQRAAEKFGWNFHAAEQHFSHLLVYNSNNETHNSSQFMQIDADKKANVNTFVRQDDDILKLPPLNASVLLPDLFIPAPIQQPAT